MESRLVANRSLMKESNRDRRSATISSLESAKYVLIVFKNIATFSEYDKIYCKPKQNEIKWN